MTGDPPRRWPDDSPEEDFEAHRAREMARHEQWMAEQKLRPIADTLAEHGVLPGDDAESWTGPLILPSWWDQVAEPGQVCAWCQRPGFPSPCDECRAARAADPGQDAEWARWTRLAPAQRRLEIAAAHFHDPWSGRHCTIRIEQTDVEPEGRIRTTRPVWFGAAPRGIFWGTRRGA